MTHEDFGRKLPAHDVSNRTFGLAITAALTTLACLPMLRGRTPRWWALALAGTMLAAAVIAPHILAPVRRAFMAVARLINTAMTFVISVVLLYAVFTPVGWFLRLRGADLLRLKRDPDAPTYWIERDPPGPVPKSMINQF